MVDEFLRALKGEETAGEDGLCAVPVTHRATLGEVADLLRQFHDQPKTLVMPEIPARFPGQKALFRLSVLSAGGGGLLPPEDERRRREFHGAAENEAWRQLSVNVSRPGVTKGQHWHHSKWELFIVVSGRALIRQRRIGSDEVLEFEVSGDRLQAVHMLPGYTHSIINLSQTEDLVTVMWASEPFTRPRPITTPSRCDAGYQAPAVAGCRRNFW